MTDEELKDDRPAGLNTHVCCEHDPTKACCDNRLSAGWQSVADGAKPGMRDLIATASDRPINDNLPATAVTGAHYYLESNGIDGVDYFLVIPPHPIKRETKEPEVWPVGGTYEMSVPAEQISDRHGESAMLVGTIAVKVLRVGVDVAFVLLNAQQIRDYYAAGGPAWRPDEPIKRES